MTKSESTTATPVIQGEQAMPIDWPRFKEIIDSHEKFLLVSHIRPDCDALGSELGMAGVLEALGKDVRIVNGQETPPNLAFLDPDKKIQAIGQDVQPEDLEEVEVIMILDTSAWAQIGPMGDVVRASRAKKIVLDHHVGEDELDAELFKNRKAEATGRLVVEAADAMGVALTAEMATVLFAAIATDTGWYRFNSTTELTYRMAARLLDAGAIPQEIYSDLYERDTLSRLQLRGRILGKAKTELDGRLIYTFVLREDFEETGALPTDTEDVINLTLEVAGTEVALIFVSLSTGGYKLSFRSRSQVDCSALAKQFGGGGHRAAAGAFYDGSIEQAQKEVLAAVRSAMK